MNVAAKLVAFAAVLVLCFGAAYAVGAAVGPLDQDPPAAPHADPITTAPSADTDAPHGSGHGG